MAITTRDGLITALASGITRPFSKASVSGAQGFFTTLFAAAGLPAAASLSIGNTTTGVTLSSSTTGAFTFSNPTGGKLTYVGMISAFSTSAGRLVLYDRLWHAGSFSFANGTINSNTSAALTRYTSGENVELWAEINTGLSATACTLTATYTDQDGNSPNTATCTIPASAIAARMFPFELAAGDYGVRAITNLTGSAAPTGTFNLVLLRRIASVSIGANLGTQVDAVGTGLEQVADNAALCMMYHCGASSTGTVTGEIKLIQG